MKKILTSYDSVHINEKIYMFVNEYNALLAINNNELEYIDSMPEEIMTARTLVAKTILYKNYIILVPFCADKIWLFNYKMNKWTGINIKVENKAIVKFLYAVVNDDKLFLFPAHYSSIVILDLLSKKIIYDSHVFKNLEIKCGKNINVKFRTDIVKRDDFIYAPLCSANYILKYDLSDNDYSWLEVPVEKGGLSGIAFDGEFFWISVRDTSEYVIKWNGKNEYKKIMTNDANISVTRGITFWNNDIYLKKNDCTLKYNSSLSEFEIIDDAYVYTDTIIAEKRLTFDGRYEYNENGKIKKIKLLNNKMLQKELLNHFYDDYKSTYTEITEFDLIDYLLLIQ